MKASPVSFRSLMCFTIDDGKPKVPVNYMVAAAFQNNPVLQGYSLAEDIFDYSAHENEVIDMSPNNTFAILCGKLDQIHRNDLPRGSNRVIISKADVMSDKTHKIEERFFVTAPSTEDEYKILKAIGNSRDFLTVRFKKKN